MLLIASYIVFVIKKANNDFKNLDLDGNIKQNPNKVRIVIKSSLQKSLRKPIDKHRANCLNSLLKISVL